MKRVLITGATGGIGRALFDRFYYSGEADIIVHGSNEKSVLDEYSAFSNVEMVAADFTKIEEVNDMLSFLRGKELNVLINNAGIYLKKPLWSCSSDEIRRMVQINLSVPMILTSHLWSELCYGKGIVINMNSLAGKKEARGEALYSASKHGLTGFSKSSQYESTRDGVRIVNVFCGAVKTQMSEGREDQCKFISPEDVAKAIHFLCNTPSTMRITEIELARMNY